MKAILKKIEFSEYNEVILKHPIKMYFAETDESDELFRFGTTIETQFCTKDEYDVKEGVTDELFQEKVKYANTLVGKIFEINLYKFTVKELTNNKHVAFEFTTDLYEDYTVEDYHIATYMTKEDVVQNLKYSITRQGLDGFVEGVLSDGSTEEITTELFFPKPTPDKKHFNIPYDKYPNINTSYIVNEVPVKDISKGQNLAYQIKDQDFPKNYINRCIHEIEDFRSKVRDAKRENESLRKKLFFWKPKVFVEDLQLPSDVISLMKDCIILGKEYPYECDKADRDCIEEFEKQVKKDILGEDVDEESFNKKWLEFRQSLRKKYKGKDVIIISN